MGIVRKEFQSFWELCKIRTPYFENRRENKEWKQEF